jgi:hypothetical protein
VSLSNSNDLSDVSGKAFCDCDSRQREKIEKNSSYRSVRFRDFSARIHPLSEGKVSPQQWLSSRIHLKSHRREVRIGRGAKFNSAQNVVRFPPLPRSLVALKRQFI